MEPETKKQKTDDIHDVQTVSLIWLDDSVDDTEENTSAQQQLRTFDTNLRTFKNENEFESYIQSQFKHARIVLIVSGKLGQTVVPRVHDFSQIVAIYVFCCNKPLHEKWAKKYTKTKDVINQFSELKDRIQMDYFNSNSSTVNQLTTLNNQHIRWTYEVDNQYIISDISMDYLSQMKPTSKEKDEFISLCQTALEEHPQRLAILQEFQENYSSNQALSWFNKEPFFYQILESVFQHTNIDTMYLCRFFLRDIQKQFQQHKCTSLIHVFRGELISDENFQQLKNFEGKIIAIKSFFSTTFKRDIAATFVSNQNEQKRILFEIEADPQIEGVKPFIKTGSLSDHNDDGHEVVFMLGSLFKINEIRDEDNGITIIKMTLCANENDNPFKTRLNDTNEEKDLIGFVQLQCDMSHFLSYPKILDNVDKLIEKCMNEISNELPDRIRCYDTLGNVTFAKGDFDSSLSWYQKSLEIKKSILPLTDPKLAECYDNIASVYLQKKNNTQALEIFKQVLTILKQIYGYDHLNLVSYYTNLINIYELEEKYSEVLSCYHQISIIMLKHYQIDDANFAPIYNNMGKAFASLHQYSLALGYYKTSLEIRLKTVPPLSESIAMAYKSVGVVYKYMEDMDQARKYLEKAAEIYRQLYTSTHETVVEIEELMQNMSSSLQ